MLTRMRVALLLVATSSAVAAAQPAYTAKLDIVDKDGAHRAVIATKLTCATPAKCPEWSLDLGRVDKAELVGLADLRGDARALRDLPAAIPEAAKLPAAFVRVDDTDGAGTHWTRLVVVGIEGRPKVLLRAELEMIKERGDSFRIREDVQLAPTATGDPLAIEYVVWIGRHNSKAPDRPRKRRFVMTNGTYRSE